MTEDSLDFLRALKPLDLYGGARTSGAEFRFKISVCGSRPEVLTVDITGRRVMPSAGDYPEPTASLLRDMADMRAMSLPVAGGAGIDLDRHPGLLDRIMQSGRMVDDDMNPLEVSADEARPVLTFEAAEDGNVLVPRLSMRAGGVSRDDFVMLTDTVAMMGGRLYRLRSTGDNYRRTGIFLSPFRKDSLAAYLSIFLTYMKNIDVEYNGFGLQYSDETVRSMPMIIFEKIDVDRSLYMRLSVTTTDGAEGVAAGLPVNYAVTVDGDGRMMAHRVEHPDMKQAAAGLLSAVRACAADRTARAGVYNSGGLFVVPGDIASEFLLTRLPELLKDYRISGVEKLRGYGIRPVAPALRLRLSSGIDYLEGSADVEVDNRVMTLQELLDEYSRHRCVTLAGGERGVVDDGLMNSLRRIFRVGRNGKVKLSFFDIPEVCRILGDDVAGTGMPASAREFYDGFGRLAAEKLSLPDINAELRPYQKEGVKWLKYLYDNGMGGCLADDMGLGKTLQTISLLSLVCKGGGRSSLVVMPRSLLFNWEIELSRFAPGIDVYTYYGQGRDFEEAMKHELVLTTYALVRNDVELFAAREFHVMVLDESQTIKNMAAMQTRSVYMLRAAHRFALSGTPVENNLSELYSLYHFLNPSMFGSFEDFNRRYVRPIRTDNDTGAMKALRSKIYPFMLRRLKRDVLADLPDRVDQTVYVDMDAPQQQLYEQRRRYYVARVKESLAAEGAGRSRFVMFQALSELRRIASVPETMSDGSIASPKIALLYERILQATANGHKVVVFFNFIAGIELLGERLVEAGVGCAQMTGSTQDRAAVVARFQTDPSCRVMLMTLKTGGVGINLTAADIVFIAEPWWNLAAEEQAVSRLHRMGQKSTVFRFSFITHDTIEEKILQLQQRKAELFEGVIGTDSDTWKNLSEEDLSFILS